MLNAGCCLSGPPGLHKYRRHDPCGEDRFTFRVMSAYSNIIYAASAILTCQIVESLSWRVLSEIIIYSFKC